MNYNEDIFIIDSWLDTKAKEDTVIKLIKSLKQFNIPILLTGHYPIKPEIQNLVDYFLFDKDNPILKHDEFADHAVSSGRWTKIDDITISNEMEFHHDYAIWQTMRNAFKFADNLGKKYIHFLEYDNLPNQFQYKQTFLNPIRENDAIIYEYCKNSTSNQSINEYCATYIFSIRTKIALEVIGKVNNKRDYFVNRPNGWQLEVLFFKYLKEVTNNIQISKYIANDNELNIHAVWDRDGVDRNGAKFQIYLAVNETHDLYIHFISGFCDVKVDEDYLVEINYGEFKSFHDLKKNQYSILEIGKYRKGDRVKVYHKGVEVFNKFLGDDFEYFYSMNKIINRNNNKIMTKLNKPEQINSNRTIKHHFIDGPFIEILDKKQGKYTVEFIDKQNGNSIYKIEINNNNWCKTLKKYFVDWEITIKGVGCDLKYNFNVKNKNVLINFESKSVGDTLGWIPYVEEFRLKHNCNIICSTFHNNLFIDGYPEIKFVEPGATVNNIYAQFRIGYYLNGDSYDTDKHPTDPRNMPLQKIAADILGLEFKEIKPRLKKTLVTSSKKVTIGFHSTAQCKYWNNPNGWQDVVDYLLENGYEPIIISKEENGYMGNNFPVGIKHIGNLDLSGTMKIIQESDFFIGISSGLSWLAWACDIPTIIISGFTDKDMEPHDNVWRVINEDVCNSCMAKLSFDPSDWNWCPINKNTENQFICSKSISSKLVIDEIKKIMNYKPNRPLP